MDALIVDYGMGNLRSVANALATLGCEPRVSANPEDARSAARIILPGVGAFGDAMGRLRSSGWVEVLQEEVRVKTKPFLGLCLGMQLLAGTSTEHGEHAGLGWVPGTVVRLDPGDPGLHVPHMGWNTVRALKTNGLLAGIPEGSTFYFVHSYVFRCQDPSAVSGLCEYGVEFPATLERGNLFATQFHPEKSQRAGLQLLRNFLAVPCR